MDQATLVIDRIKETRKLIDRLAEEHHLVVSAAFWMNSLEDDEWTLHIVSPTINEVGIGEGYLAIILTLKDHPEIQIDADDIRPQRTDEPPVVEVLDFLQRYPSSEAFRLKGVFLKGHFVQQAYIYPVLLKENAKNTEPE